MTDDPFLRRAPALGVGVLLLALVTITTADSDLWGHLRFGLDTLKTRSLPSRDPYSFTQDLPWINHEWLSELAMAVAWTLGGTAGLALLKGGLAAAALFLVWRASAPLSLGARFVLFAAVAAATAPVTRTLRPQLWTLLCLVVLCRVLAERHMGARRWFPLLFAIWANMHGGWVVGLGVLGAWTAAEVIASRRLDLATVAIVVASVLATLATPYGWQLWWFLASTVRMGRDITEWQPLWNVPPADVVPWLATVGMTAWIGGRAPRDRWPRLAVLLMLAYASARVVRIVPLFVACAGVLLVEALAVRWPRQPGKPAFERSRHDRAAAAVIAAVTLAIAAWVASSSTRCVKVESPRAPDSDAMRVLRGRSPGRLVTFFDWGQYAIWHLGPDIRVSMDGRRETVYSDVRLDEHAAVLEGRPEGLTLLAEWHPEYVWLPATSVRTRDWLVGHGYRLEHAGPRSFVAVRGDLPAGPPSSPSMPPRCFPG